MTTPVKVRTVSDLIGRTVVFLEGVKKNSDRMELWTADTLRFSFYHESDCCEWVNIEDVVGDPEDLLDTPILIAEEVSSDDEPPPEDGGGSYTWTFYRFATVKGSVTVRWLGESNGYYSEEVSFSVDRESPCTKHGDDECTKNGLLGAACRKFESTRRTT